MSVVTIPKKLTGGEDLVILPKEEYEKIISARQIQEFNPTTKEKRDLIRARKNRKEGKFLTVHELRQKLGFTN